MNKYGQAAVRAIRVYATAELSPEQAWEGATVELFGAGTSGQRKGCPRGAFLGLCEDGYVAGIAHGSYTLSRKNKDYAIRALAILRESPGFAADPEGLWRRVQGGVQKQHNSQMDVVIALWNAGLIS